MNTEVKYNKRHGGPYDRGSADAWYGRRFNPHYYSGDTRSSTLIEITDDESPEYDAYRAGYNEQTDRKDWG
jgi:hypothetical protein